MLDRIMAHKREEVRLLKQDHRLASLEPRRKNPALPEALRAEGQLKVIAEIKKASPSKGILCENFDPLRLARLYEQNGAAAISVLSDTRFFQGSPQYVKQVKSAVSIPVLRKDFVIDEIQLYESLAMGADMILLIAGVLEYPALLKLAEKASELGLEVLLETHSADETILVADLPVQIAGINNRNLRSFEVSLDTSLKLVGSLPASVIKVSESGIKSPRDLKILAEHGFDAALMGEVLVTDKSPGLKLKELLYYQEIRS